MHIPSSGRPPVVYSKFTHSQQSLASLYIKMNPNLCHKALFKEEKQWKTRHILSMQNMTCVGFELKSSATNANVVTTSPSAILWVKRK